MATLNVSLPDQLRSWITEQVEEGRYSSASDYLRDLIREDIRDQEQGIQLLSNYLKPLVDTPNKLFVSNSANDVKSRARSKMKEQSWLTNHSIVSIQKQLSSKQISGSGYIPANIAWISPSNYANFFAKNGEKPPGFGWSPTIFKL